MLGDLAFYLAFIGAGLACIYPFTKRFFHCPQLVLGLAFSWGIPMAFAAQTHSVPLAAWWLFGISSLWALIYDTQYAMVDRDDDLAIGIHSSAILFGQSDRWVIACLQLIMMLLWAGFAFYYHLARWFWLGWSASGFVFIWQAKSIWSRDRKWCFRAFLSNHWVGMWLFFGLLAGL